MQHLRLSIQESHDLGVRLNECETELSRLREEEAGYHSSLGEIMRQAEERDEPRLKMLQVCTGTIRLT
jgi:hypothetical protein